MKQEIITKEYTNDIEKTINEINNLMKRASFEFAVFVYKKTNELVKKYKIEENSIWKDLSNHQNSRWTSYKMFYKAYTTIEKFKLESGTGLLPYSTYEDLCFSGLEEQKLIELKEEAEENKWSQQELRIRLKEIKLDEGSLIGFDMNRPLVKWEDGFYYDSEINHKDVRQDAYHIIKEGEPFPTLKRRSWFFHEDGTEFSLREYANVQEFPKDYKFVGTKEKIKDQIGNAVAPPMVKHITKSLEGNGNFIELFAGCGGSSTGLEQKGWNCLWMNERNVYACKTFKLNHPNVFINSWDIKKVGIDRIKKETKGKKIDLVFGGVPCQGFSLSGLGFKDDPRNELYKEFIRVVDGIKPKQFIMENVMGISPHIDQIRGDFENIDYDVEIKVVKGEDIGMRQKRHRVFFVGKRK